MRKLVSTLIIAGFFLTNVAIASAAGIYIPPFDGQQKVSPKGIDYLSGGVGITERTQMKAMDKGYNMELIFDNHAGAYLSAVTVTIESAGGKELANAVSDGPWFFAKLPEGHYRVTTYFDNKHKTRDITIGPHAKKTILESWSV